MERHELPAIRKINSLEFLFLVVVTLLEMLAPRIVHNSQSDRMQTPFRQKDTIQVNHGEATQNVRVTDTKMAGSSNGDFSRGGHYLTIAARQAAGHENSLYKSRTGMSASLATYKYIIIYTFIILSGESIHPTEEHRRGASNMARWQWQKQSQPLAILTTIIA